METIETNFDAIYKEHAPKVYRLCMGYANGDTALAKEWLQETFIKVWNHRKSFKGNAALSTWIYRIALNTCLSSLRSKKQKHLSLNNLQVEATTDPDELETTTNPSRVRDLYQCIDQLTHQNKTLILMELEQIPQETIATTTGLKYGAVRTRLSRIKTALLKCLKNGK